MEPNEHNLTGVWHGLYSYPIARAPGPFPAPVGPVFWEQTADERWLCRVRARLADQPAHRFHFIFTPKHGSWVNLVEGFFSKPSRSMLRHIRVLSKQELKERMMHRHRRVLQWWYKQLHAINKQLSEVTVGFWQDL